MLRDTVAHYRLEKLRVGAGWRQTYVTLPALVCAFEERPPVNRVTGEVLTQGTTGQLGCRQAADVLPEDLIVRNGQAWRVIGPVAKARSVWIVWHLERVNPGQIPAELDET